MRRPPPLNALVVGLGCIFITVLAGREVLQSWQGRVKDWLLISSIGLFFLIGLMLLLGWLLAWFNDSSTLEFIVRPLLGCAFWSLLLIVFGTMGIGLLLPPLYPAAKWITGIVFTGIALFAAVGLTQTIRQTWRDWRSGSEPEEE